MDDEEQAEEAAQTFTRPSTCFRLLFPPLKLFLFFTFAVIWGCSSSGTEGDKLQPQITATPVGSPGYVVVDGCTSVQEDDDAHEGGWDQHLCVETQPGKVQSDLFTKILPEWDKSVKSTGFPCGDRSERMLACREAAVLTARVQRVGT